ncbi:MAG: Na(+)/H(+) antiporter subunit C [Acidimicrobiia bacterium]
MTVILALGAGVLVSCGTYLVLQRQLTRVIFGFALMSHGANLVLLTAGGGAGGSPIIGEGEGGFADPLVQAMILTAIVITFGVTAFLLALAYRSWQLTHDDQGEDDREDKRIARLAQRRSKDRPSP